MDSIHDREAAIAQVAESEVALEQLREHLKEIIEGQAFSGSDRCSQFLLYIMHQAIAGRCNSLKERVIGVEVFGRPSTYSTSEDAIVRVTASDVRKRLRQHYWKNGGSAFRINLPVGSYVPEVTCDYQASTAHFDPQKADQPAVIRFSNSTEARESSASALLPSGMSSEKPLSLADSETAFSKKPFMARIPAVPQVVTVLVLLLVLLNLVLWGMEGASHNKAAALSVPPWSALFNSPRSTHLITSDPEIVPIQGITGSRISLSDYVNQNFFSERSTLAPQIKEILLDTLHQDLATPGDTRIAVSLAELAQSSSRTISVQPSSRTRVSDLKTDDNFIFLGSPRSNPWVSLYNDRLDFQFFTPQGTQNEEIRNVHPKPNEQSIYIPTTGNAGESYAIVAFVQNPDQDGQVILLAGATGQGTDAAGRFVTDLPRLSTALRNCGVSSSHPLEHFELLLRVSVMVGSTRGLDVAACHIL
jgi:hypothetical protein